MTVPVSTYRAGPYAGNGVATVFAFDFKVFVKEDLQVVLGVIAAGTESDLVLDSDYTVTLNPDQEADPGGSVTYNPSGSPMTSANTLTIVSNLEITQPLDLTNGGGFFPEVIEAELDRATILIGQQNETLSRSLTLPVSTPTGVSTELPVPVASTFIGWNVAGTALVNYAGVASAAVSAAWAAVVGAATLPLGRAAMGFSAYFDTLIGAANAAAFRALIGVDISLYALKGSNSDITALTALTSGSVFRKNALINGDFQIWQEGTSFAAIAVSTYTAEMWKYSKTGAMVHTVSQSSDVPTIAEAGRKLQFSLLVDCTTVDAAIAAGDYCAITTYVEGYNFVYIAGVGLCLQFWHKHTKTGTYCVAFNNSNSDRSFVREYTQAVSDTWEFASVLVGASPTAGTWDYTTGVGLQVTFTIAAGSTYQGAAGAWTAANFFATANQVNACDNVANNFRLAGVQLEKGSVPTEFEAMKIQDVEQLCKRYFRTIGGTSTYAYVATGTMYNTTGAYCGLVLDPPMRTVPALTLSAVGDWRLLCAGTASALSSLTFLDAGPTDVTFTAIASGAIGASNDCAVLQANNTAGARLKLSARF